MLVCVNQCRLLDAEKQALLAHTWLFLAALTAQAQSSLNAHTDVALVERRTSVGFSSRGSQERFI